MEIQSENDAIEILDASNRNPLEREAAGRYLEHHPRAHSIPRLVAALRDEDEGVRRAVAEALVRLGVMAWPDLLMALMDAKSAGDPRLVRGAQHILHHSPLAPEVTASLLRELQRLPASDISAMIEADRLYKQMLLNDTFAARIAAMAEIKRNAGPILKEGESMDIPLDANVKCAGEVVGQSRMVIVDPVGRQVTHFVVEEKDHPGLERLVSLELVETSSSEVIQLNCTRGAFGQQKLFVDAEYIRPNLPYMAYLTGQYALWPYFPPAEFAPVSPEHFHVPPGELAVSRGTRVEATDAHAGRVDEFLVDPQTGQITHLVLREGHLWGQKDVTIPVAQIDHISDEAVFLKLDAHGIEALPTVPVEHWLFR